MLDSVQHCSALLPGVANHSNCNYPPFPRVHDRTAAHDITRGGSSSASNGGPAPIMVPPADPYYSWFSNQTPVAQQSRTSLPYIRTNFTRWVKAASPNAETNYGHCLVAISVVSARRMSDTTPGIAENCPQLVTSWHTLSYLLMIG